MAKVIHIHPVTRIEGHARIGIHLDDRGNVCDTRLHVTSLRGFEQFIEGRAAEEVPRIVTRICGICPWMHHLASVKAVDGCFHVAPTGPGHKLRELCQVMAHINDKILHFFFLAGPDFVLGPDSDVSVRNIMGIVKKEPELAARVIKMRQIGQMMLERFTGRAIHPVAGVVGGFARPMLQEERQLLLQDARTLLDFSLYALDYAKKTVFQRYGDIINSLGSITSGFLGTVDSDGSLQLYDGQLRLMTAEGQCTDFSPHDYLKYLAEHVEPWSYSKMVYAQVWGQEFSMHPDSPGGIYRANSLARINTCEQITSPHAQAALEEFRSLFGRPAQATLLYHWARLIELIYVCERTIELLEDDEITRPNIRNPAEPQAGRGVGHVEAPRGTLIHDYETDDNGCITRANMIVGTTHNMAAMNMSVRQAAASLIKNGSYDETILNRVEMAVRAYDP